MLDLSKLMMLRGYSNLGLFELIWLIRSTSLAANQSDFDRLLTRSNSNEGFQIRAAQASRRICSLRRNGWRGELILLSESPRDITLYRQAIGCIVSVCEQYLFYQDTDPRKVFHPFPRVTTVRWYQKKNELIIINPEECASVKPIINFHNR